MKKIVLFLPAVSLMFASLSGCIQEYEPQGSTVTSDQVLEAPGALETFVSALTSTLAGYPTYTASRSNNIASDLTSFPYDFGFTSFWIARDHAGQDMVPAKADRDYGQFYSCGTALGPRYALTQWPWTVYYKWISSCNELISMIGEDPDPSLYSALGRAYAMRAMYYMDLAQMYNQKAYGVDKTALTVPLVTETTTDFAHNPRLTNEEMWTFILGDLDQAETLLANFDRGGDITQPDLSVVYGLKARAYLVTEQWKEAEDYAKRAQVGYSLTTEAQYTDRNTGFNTPTSSWMMSTGFRSTDYNIIYNDGDSSFGSFMCLELNRNPNGIKDAGCGYAANYGYPISIDRHLYETIPATDFRKKCFVNFDIDDLPDRDAKIQALSAYSDYPEYLYDNLYVGSYAKTSGGVSLKFRLAGGAAGHEDQHIGFVVQLPIMRVEEMYLIEAEAAGMQDPTRGEALLTAFAKTRDPNYTYGTHRDAYGNTSTSAFQNECWWQRRVEFWGEGLSMYDIKRLNKGIIRSYPGTNHLEDFRWNTTEPPAWMTLCFVETESANNYALEPNPTPIAPTADSPEYQF